MQVLRSLPARLVTLLALVLAGVPAAPASAAATVVVPLSARGTPSRTTVAPGTILAFRNEDRIARSVRSSTPNWSFAVAMIRPGQTFTLRSALTVPADYRYSSRDRLHPTTAFDGTVRVAAPPLLPGGVLSGPGAPGAGLAQPSTGREFGLPALLALLAVAGVASLLVRLLLAETAARRRTASGLSTSGAHGPGSEGSDW